MPRSDHRGAARRAAGTRAALLLGGLALGTAAPLSPALGFDADALSPAQKLVYETPHLAGTEPGDELGYAYSSAGDAGGGPAPAATDRATLTVAAAHEDGRRDVRLDFLSGERRLELPSFDGWRANPVLLAAFERFAQDFASAGGGGALYFRNRMRDALVAGATTEAVELVFDGAPVAATRIELRPFENDPYVGARPGFADAVVRLELSDEVPGGVLSAAVVSGSAPGAPPRRELRLDGAGW